eukprot:m.286663 g.286663  ORF g.286663 m.286663 type:complete len:55 (-) comp22927_c0_seq2:152-316(-)
MQNDASKPMVAILTLAKAREQPGALKQQQASGGTSVLQTADVAGRVHGRGVRRC